MLKIERAFVCAVVAALASRAGADPGAADWPQFRGPGARGVSEASGLPDVWSRTANVVWSVPVPGRGWSCPVVWGDRVFLTSALRDGPSEEPKKGLYFGGERPRPPEVDVRWVVYCLDVKDGAVRWEKTVHEGKPARGLHIKNSYASETPVTDGKRLYAYFGNVGMFAFDLDGKELWSRRWEAVDTRFGWGTSASPVIDGDRVFVLNDNEDQSWLEALDAASGKTLWRVERDEESNWSTPYVWRHDDGSEIVTAGTGAVRSYSLAGEPLWSLRGMSSITIATPFAAHGLLYVSSGYVGDDERPIHAIRPGGRGDITPPPDAEKSEFVAWSAPTAAPYNPSTLVAGEYLYVLFDRGFFACHDAKSGKPIYGKQRLVDSTAGFTASPWAYGGKVFCLNEDGDTFVIEAGPEFRVLDKNPLEEMCMATPAIAAESLFIRTLTRLYRIARTGEGPRGESISPRSGR